jgi:hypothetical protein
MLLTEGQMSDHKGARLMLGALPKAKTLIADRGYDSNWFRNPLRPLRPHLLLGNLYRSSRPLLSQSMSPEPRFAKMCYWISDHASGARRP